MQALNHDVRDEMSPKQTAAAAAGLKPPSNFATRFLFLWRKL